MLQYGSGTDLTIQEACAALRNLLIKIKENKKKNVNEETTFHAKKVVYINMYVATEGDLRNVFVVGTDK